jgi:enamine deaminase RidA (YjgF/YER057c/UK114 family)
MNVEARIEQLKLELPPHPKPVGVYKPVLLLGDLAYVSGHGPITAESGFITGRVGAQLDLAAAKSAARTTGLAILASLRATLGSLDRVERIVKTFGMVNCTAEFLEHPEVINGCSELFADIWGPEKGVGARSAIGVGSLPRNIPVEIEAVFALK